MAIDDQKQTGFPLVPSLVALVLLGAVAAQFREIKSNRPANDPMPGIFARDENWVHARLWQDPLAAVYREIEERRKESSKEDSSKPPLDRQNDNDCGLNGLRIAPKFTICVRAESAMDEGTDSNAKTEDDSCESQCDLHLFANTSRRIKDEQKKISGRLEEHRRRLGRVKKVKRTTAHSGFADPHLDSLGSTINSLNDEIDFWESATDALSSLQADLRKAESSLDVSALDLPLLPDEPPFRNALLLPVLLSGKAFADDVENRVRVRYSVLSSLARAGYVPKATSRIRWLGFDVSELRDGTSHVDTEHAETGQATSIVVPYEEMYRSKLKPDAEYSHIYVVWIDEDRLFGLLCGSGVECASVDDLEGAMGKIQVRLRSRLARLAERLSVSVRSRDREIDALEPVAQAAQLINDKLDELIKEGRAHGIESSESLSHLRVSEEWKDSQGLRNKVLCEEWPTVVLGPTNSTAYFRLVEGHRQPRLDEFSILCPWSTTPESVLETLREQTAAEVAYWPGDAASGIVRRTNVDDGHLINTLIDELKKRGVEATKDQIVLIAEWDTLYGRGWECTLRNEVAKRRDPFIYPINSPYDCSSSATNLTFFTYVKGLDGRIPERRSKTKESEASPNLINDNAQALAGEEPVGNNQLDYLRRLEARLKLIEKDDNKKHGKFRAIGIVGSDVYDKLMLLQALRPAFPDAVFFTTDLDARLAHRSQYKHTNNLIVASGFGLQLSEHLQGDIPPFRDSYQTAMYLTTLLAVKHTDAIRALLGDEDGFASEKLVDYSSIEGAIAKLSPRIFEIGRHGPVDLSDSPEPQIESGISPEHSDAQRAGARNSPYGIHPPAPINYQRYRWQENSTWVLIVIWLSCLIAWLLLTPMFRHKSNWMMRRNTESNESLSPKAQFLTPILVATLVTGLSYGLIQVVLDLDEPIAFTGGVSVWPTEILQVVAVLASILFLGRAVYQQRENVSNLDGPVPDLFAGREEVFVPPAIASEEREQNCKWTDVFSSFFAWGKEASRDDVSVRCIWDRYRALCKLRPWRTAVLVILHVWIAAGLILLMEFPFIPARGNIVRSINVIGLIVTVLSFLVLTYYVFDASRLAYEFFQRISGRRVYWHWWAHEVSVSPNRCREHIRCSLNKLRLIANHSNVIGAWVFYPLIVLLIMLVSRSKIFDYWIWPPTLIAVIGLATIMVFASGIMVQVSAHRARAVAVKIINEELDFLNGLSHDYLSALSKDKIRPAPTVEQLNHALAEIKSLRIGAFAPFSENPLLRALLIPTGGIGLLELIIFLSSGDVLPAGM